VKEINERYANPPTEQNHGNVRRQANVFPDLEAGRSNEPLEGEQLRRLRKDDAPLDMDEGMIDEESKCCLQSEHQKSDADAAGESFEDWAREEVTEPEHQKQLGEEDAGDEGAMSRPEHPDESEVAEEKDQDTTEAAETAMPELSAEEVMSLLAREKALKYAKVLRALEEDTFGSDVDGEIPKEHRRTKADAMAYLADLAEELEAEAAKRAKILQPDSENDRKDSPTNPTEVPGFGEGMPTVRADGASAKGGNVPKSPLLSPALEKFNANRMQPQGKVPPGKVDWGRGSGNGLGGRGKP
jgi:hypothetical protein